MSDNIIKFIMYRSGYNESGVREDSKFVACY